MHPVRSQNEVILERRSAIERVLDQLTHGLHHAPLADVVSGERELVGFIEQSHVINLLKLFAVGNEGRRDLWIDRVAETFQSQSARFARVDCVFLCDKIAATHHSTG
jgi:hypothetical protein